jgi:GNAT superfamily N-acetyltransferase
VIDSQRLAETSRTVLSALHPESLAAMPWLEAALAPEWASADLETAVAAENGVLIGDTAGDPIGVAVVLRDVPLPGCASIPFLAIDPERRFRGLGGEAGLALFAHLRAQGVEKVYAPVPDGRGLAVYFWLRLGFRPLTTPESPGPVSGLSGEMRGIWMLREDRG